MSAVLGVIDDPFNAPVQYGLVESLINDYTKMRRRILEVGNLMQGEIASTVGFFIEGNVPRERHLSLNVGQLFDITGAVAALNSHYWQKAMALTNVLDLMPQARRTEWHEQIHERKCPDFTEEAVRPTLEHLLNSRAQFFAERVDGIFRALSDVHLTNAPQGFGRRMIIQYVINSYGSVDHTRAGFINDLRCVIAKFMGRDEPNYRASDSAIDYARRRRGEWISLDGGALRLRVYKIGTAHLEVHEDMAWRLNAVLASLHPMAIPASFRTAPPTKKNKKTFQLMERPLPFALLETLRQMRRGGGRSDCRSLTWAYGTDKAVREELAKVITALGGAPTKDGFAFDYDCGPVLDEVLASGCIPDQKSHQFYPTPSALAARLVDMAQVEDVHRVLEPSAGTGNLARHIPTTSTTCVEVSPLNCEVLKAIGFEPVQADFLEWAKTAPRFDRVVMNPPFSEGRALTHLQAAAELLVPGGRLAAIVPASFRGKDVLPGYELEWSQVIDNEFAGTSVSVVMLAATRSSAAIVR